MAQAAATIEAPAQAHAYVEGALKWLIALAVILCTILEVLDSSIVNVALPHMQGSFSASVDEVTWVVTTYLVAAGIMIPTTGWIAGQFGRKSYFLVSYHHLRSVVRDVRSGADARSDGRVPLSPGHRRRGAAAALAGDPDGDVSAQRADAGDGDVGGRPDGRADHGSDRRWLDHRQLELALEFLHQRSDRRRRRFDGLHVRPRSAVLAQAQGHGTRGLSGNSCAWFSRSASARS